MSTVLRDNTTSKKVGCMQVYVHRIRKYIGAYMVHLKGKVDAIVMSAGVGENSPPVRKLLLADLEVGELSSSLFLCLSEIILTFHS